MWSRPLVRNASHIAHPAKEKLHNFGRAFWGIPDYFGNREIGGVHLQHGCDVDAEAAHAVDVPALELWVSDEALQLLMREGEAPLHKLAERLGGHADLGRVEAILVSMSYVLDRKNVLDFLYAIPGN